MEALSLKVLRERLIDAFIFQSKDEHDYGTDVILEAVESDSLTNFRVHLQLKATGTPVAADGSVGVQVPITNLNYLLSQPESIYVLYAEATDTLYYRTTESVDRTRRDNRQSKTITVRFADKFDRDAQLALHSRVLRTGRKHRSLRIDWSKLPPTGVAVALDRFERNTAPVVPTSVEEAKNQLTEIRRQQREPSILSVASEYLQRFPDDAELAALVHSSVIDSSSAGHSVSEQLLRAAAEFWEKELGATHFAPRDARYNAANAHSAMSNSSRAVELYSECLAEVPGWTEARKNLSGALINLGRIDEAIEQLEKVIATDPLFFQARFSLGTLASQRREYSDALAHFKVILISDLSMPERASVYSWLARTHSAMSNHIDAIVHGELAIESAPAEPWAWEAAAQAYSSGRRAMPALARRAATFWQRFAAHEPGRVEIWAELGFSLYSLADDDDHKTDRKTIEKGIAAFERCLELGHTDGGLVADRMGHLHEKLGSISSATKAYEKAAAEDEPKFGYCLGCALMDAGDLNRALPYLLASAEKYERDATAWKQVARCYSKMEQFTDALAAYERASELDPQDPFPLFEAGGIWWNTGCYEDAKRIWALAMALHLDHPLTKQTYEFLSANWHAETHEMKASESRPSSSDNSDRDKRID